MLKSTITPAVIKGQKEYHQKWLSALKEWIDDHPDDFTTPAAIKAPAADAPDTTKPAPVSAKQETLSQSTPKPPMSVDTKVAPPASLAHRITGFADDQVILALVGLCVLSMTLNYYLLTRWAPFVKEVAVAIVP